MSSSYYQICDDNLLELSVTVSIVSVDAWLVTLNVSYMPVQFLTLMFLHYLLNRVVSK